MIHQFTLPQEDGEQFQQWLYVDKKISLVQGWYVTVINLDLFLLEYYLNNPITYDVYINDSKNPLCLGPALTM